MKVKPTPRPWTVAYYAGIGPSEGKSHCAIKRESKTIVRTANEVATDEDCANVEHLARCVRAFEPGGVVAELVAFAASVALYQTSDETGVRNRTPIQERFDERIAAARSALARYEESTG